MFELSLASSDRLLVEALHSFLGSAGTIRQRPPRGDGWQPETCLTIASERLHLARTIPLAERFLDACHKRAQYEAWRDELLAYPEFIAGFVVAEGTFVTSGNGRRFAFTIGVADVDAALCDELRAYFGVGRVYRYGRRREHHHDVAIYTVQSKVDLRRTIVPFMDRFLPPSNKRRQYVTWRTALTGYSLTAAGSSETSDSQSTGEASDQRRSRS